MQDAVQTLSKLDFAKFSAAINIAKRKFSAVTGRKRETIPAQGVLRFGGVTKNRKTRSINEPEQSAFSLKRVLPW